MKCFSIWTNEQPGALEVKKSPYPHIHLGGEEGDRFSENLRFPVENRFFDQLERPEIERASILRLSDGRLVIVDEKDAQDKRALILLQVPAGRRGEATYALPSNVKVVATATYATRGSANCTSTEHKLVIVEPQAKIVVTRNHYSSSKGDWDETFDINWDGEKLTFSKVVTSI